MNNTNYEASTPSQETNRGYSEPNNGKMYHHQERSFGRSLKNFIRNIGIILTLSLLILSSLFAYIIIFPKQPLSEFIVTNTPLNELISLNNTQESSSATIQNVKPGNIFFGLEEDNLSSQQTTVKLVSQTLPSVLSIRVNSGSDNQIRSTVDGTGFVVSSGGLVVTNRHVISGACNSSTPLNITAQDSGGNAYDLKLLSIDPIDDISILQITNPTDKISPVVLGNSDELNLGEEVIAIGNVLGQLNNSVTRGIVSGLDRILDTGIVDDCTQSNIVADGLIQTDAAINKGNSGGPLFDYSGQLIGMNTFGTTEAQSVGFATPSSSIIYAVRSFNDNGKIIRPRLGVYTQAITPVDRKSLTWLPTDNGEIIIAPADSQAIAPGSGAETAGLREGDIITAVNGTKVEFSATNQRPLRKLLLQYKPNDLITLTIHKIIDRSNGIPTYATEESSVTVTLGGISVDNFAK